VSDALFAATIIVKKAPTTTKPNIQSNTMDLIESDPQNPSPSDAALLFAGVYTGPLLICFQKKPQNLEKEAISSFFFQGIVLIKEFS
jgi:hypothetical protein